jgi:hypothetical protein
MTLFIRFSRLVKTDGATSVIKVAMVCNDLAIANSSMGTYRAKTGSLGHIGLGGLKYFSRVSCGHLSEGMQAIKEIRDQPHLHDFVSQYSAAAQSAFRDLCECLPGGKDHQTFKQFVGWIRNRIAFHYDAKEIRWALEYCSQTQGSDISSMTGGGDIHSTRWEFADALLDAIVCRRFWEIPRGADLEAEANRIADWCFKRTLRFLEFGEDFVPRFLRAHGVVK